MTERAKRPRDANQLAKFIVDVATGEADDDAPEKAEGQQRGGLKGGKATLNLKSRIEERTAEGAPQTCHEFEYEIPRGDGERLLELARCTIAKMRYVMPDGLELDVFEGRHAGLVMAEMEVAEGTPCPHPPPGWEWRDVSHDPRYSNRWMAEHGIPPA